MPPPPRFEEHPDAADRAAGRTYVVVWIANFLAAIGMMAFLPFFPSYLRGLGVPEANLSLWAGLCMGAAPLAAALMGPVWGALGDRFGRKPMVLRALFGLVVFVGLMSLARTPVELLVLRIGQGVFSGFLPPSVTMVTMSFPSGRGGRIAGGLQAAMASGAILGPLFGSLFRETFEARFLFLATASLCAVGGLLVLVFTREPLAAGGRLIGDVAAPGLRDLFGDLFVRLFSMLKKPRLGLALGFLFAAQFGIGATNPQLELFVGQLEPGISADLVGRHTAWLFSAMALCGVFAMPFWGRVGDRFGHGRVLLMAAGMAGLALCLSGLAPGYWTLFGGRVLLGLFASGLGPAAFGLVALVTPREEQGAANGAVFSSRALAMATSSMLGGFFVGAVGMRALFLAGGVALLFLTVWATRRMWER
jgi:DHA1 family multidrug resistance protein-like MFS transporter